MILLCPLIHPPNRCRSQWLYTNAFFPSILWISVRLVSSGNERCSKGEMRVWAFLCLCLEEPCWCVCVCVHVHCAVVWLDGMGVVWSVCLFVFVISYSLPSLLVMDCLWDTDIKLSDRLSSAFEVSWAVHPGLSTTGDQPSTAAVWRSLIFHVL